MHRCACRTGECLLVPAQRQASGQDGTRSGAGASTRIRETQMAQTRKLLPTEAPLLAEHLIRLSPDDRRLRFGGLFKPDDVIRRYVQGIDWIHSRQVGCFDAGALRGVVQLSLPRSN